MIVEGYGLTETSPVLMGAPLSDRRRHGLLGLPFASTEVRLWAERTISHYALPRFVAVLAELPRNPLGTVMRRRVRELIISGTVLPLPNRQVPKNEGFPLNGGEGAVGSSPHE